MLSRYVIAMSLAAVAGGDLTAQTTGTPVFLAPRAAFRASELGGFFTDPGNGFTLEGMYRYGKGTYDVGFRIGVGDNDVEVPGGPSSTFFLAGLDFRQRVVNHTEAFPLDGALTLGIGGIFGDEITTGLIPVGISLGRRVDLEGTTTSFVPYFHPVLVPTFGDAEDSLQFGIGLGVDIKFSPRLDARVAAGLGDYDGISLGVSFTR